jgi:hypothetical protein
MNLSLAAGVAHQSLPSLHSFFSFSPTNSFLHCATNFPLALCDAGKPSTDIFPTLDSFQESYPNPDACASQMPGRLADAFDAWFHTSGSIQVLNFLAQALESSGHVPRQLDRTCQTRHQQSGTSKDYVDWFQSFQICSY